MFVVFCFVFTYSSDVYDISHTAFCKLTRSVLLALLCLYGDRSLLLDN